MTTPDKSDKVCVQCGDVAIALIDGRAWVCAPCGAMALLRRALQGDHPCVGAMCTLRRPQAGVVHDSETDTWWCPACAASELAQLHTLRAMTQAMS